MFQDFPLENTFEMSERKNTNGIDQGSVEPLTCKCSKHGNCDLCTPETYF